MRMSARSVLLAGASAIAITAMTTIPQPLKAQAEFGALEEIAVTARRRDETLLDVPASVTVFTSRDLEQADIERAEDFINLTAGVTIVDTAEVGDTQINIRGINGTRDAEASFAFVIDGILLTNPSSFNREFSALEQIEILKGPQGALYGRNAAAGAIVVNTKRPGNDFEAEVEVSGGSQQTFVGAARLAGPVVEDELYAQIAIDYRDTDGFYTNDFLQRDVVDDYQGFNINGRLVWEPTADTTVDLKARYGEVEAGAISFDEAFHLPIFAGVFAAGTPDGEPGALFFEDVNDHDFAFQNNIDPLNEQESYEISVKVDHSFDFADLTVWALYSDVNQFFFSDGTSADFRFFAEEPLCQASTQSLFDQGVQIVGAPFLIPDTQAAVFGPYSPTTCDGTQTQVRDQSDFSIEASLAGDYGDRLQWGAGLYFLTLTREVGVATNIDTGNPPNDRLFNPPGQGFPSPTEQLVNDEFDTNVYAVFGNIDYDVTDALSASVALRYDAEVRKVQNLVPTFARTQFIDFDGPPFDGGAPLNPGLNPAINPTGEIPDDKETFQQIQPKISLTYTPTDDLTLFANWGIGFKSGGFNNQGSAATIQSFIVDTTGSNVTITDVFDKETSSAFEVGIKGNLMGGRLTFEAAGYYTDVEDMQFFEFFVGPFGLLRVVSNIDEVEIYGGELAAQFRVTDTLTVFASGNITESEIKANSARPLTVGNSSPYTPDYTLNIGAQLDQPVTSGINFVGRVDYRLTGPTWFHTVQADEVPTLFGVPGDYSVTRRDEFGIVNLRAGFEGENWSIAGFVNNLTGNDYLEEVIPAPEFGGSFISPGERRSWGIELGYRF